jgi:hypothetical protein
MNSDCPMEERKYFRMGEQNPQMRMQKGIL